MSQEDATLHPFIVSMLAKMRQAEMPALSAGTPADARAMLAAGRAAMGPAAPLRARRSIDIPTRGGSIPAVLLVPEGDVAGLCVYLHGGGWVVGTPADYETLGSALANRSGCAILVPDYRLAPEHPFPAGLEDSEDALLWAWANREALLGAARPMVVAGDSAGGNLATVAAHRLRGRLTLAGQVLIYPVTDCDFTTPSYRTHGTGLNMTGADMAWFFRQYAPPEQWTDPAIAPLRLPGLDGCPPAVVALAGFDVLHDEGRTYAARLDQAGLLVALREYPSVTHGFIRLHNLLDVADQAVSELADDIGRFCR